MKTTLNLPSTITTRPLTPGLASGDAEIFAPIYRSPTAITERGPLSCPLITSSSPKSPVFEPSNRIRPGTYVAFALATSVIAEQFPEGSKPYERVRNYERNVYIGLVSDSYMTPVDESNSTFVNEIVVHFASRETPSRSSPDDYCFPMHPTTGEHAREPSLRSTMLFPYADCMQWTVLGIKLTAEEVHASSLVFSLGDDEFERFEEAAVIDYAVLESFNSEELATELSGLRLPQYALAAEIWRDVRVGDADCDPAQFAEEIQALELMVSLCSNGA